MTERDSGTDRRIESFRFSGIFGDRVFARERMLPPNSAVTVKSRNTTSSVKAIRTCGPHRKADIGARERGPVVDAVPDHADKPPFTDIAFDHLELVHGKLVAKRLVYPRESETSRPKGGLTFPRIPAIEARRRLKPFPAKAGGLKPKAGESNSIASSPHDMENFPKTISLSSNSPLPESGCDLRVGGLGCRS